MPCPNKRSELITNLRNAVLARARGAPMATLTLSEAARVCNGARTTMQRAIKTGRLSLDAAHRVDTAELLRVGYQLAAAVLPAAAQQVRSRTQQPMNSSYYAKNERPCSGSGTYSCSRSHCGTRC